MNMFMSSLKKTSKKREAGIKLCLPFFMLYGIVYRYEKTHTVFSEGCHIARMISETSSMED